LPQLTEAALLQQGRSEPQPRRRVSSEAAAWFLAGAALAGLVAAILA
jgi:type VI protein secretion system component VasF